MLCVAVVDMATRKVNMPQALAWEWTPPHYDNAVMNTLPMMKSIKAARSELIIILPSNNVK